MDELRLDLNITRLECKDAGQRGAVNLALFEYNQIGM